MTDSPSKSRAPDVFYGSLAAWWPLISPVEDYTEEAAEAARLLRSGGRPVRTVLELGSGGGHNAAHLKSSFALTLVDLSEPMLEVSRALNPECRHIQGDMRSLRLEQEFDAVFVHDAIAYMTTQQDLARVLDTALCHCAPGGTLVIMPDATRESFEPGTQHGGCDAADGRGLRYLEWTTDPDPSDEVCTTEYVFALRHADGTLTIERETHTFGLFTTQVWMRLIRAAGFDARTEVERTTEDRDPRTIFVGQRPA